MKVIQKIFSLFVVASTLLGQVNLALIAEGAVNNDEIIVSDNNLEENDENIEDTIELNEEEITVDAEEDTNVVEEIVGEGTETTVSNFALSSGTEILSTCNIGVDTIEDCFGNTAWARAVASKVGVPLASPPTWSPAGNSTIPNHDITRVFTTAMANSVTQIHGVNELTPFRYNKLLIDGGGIFLPKMTGLGNFPNLTTLTDITFVNTRVVDTDIGTWAEAPNLTTIRNINFTNIQLTDIGDLGKWGQAPNLTTLANIRFDRNQLTDVGDLGKWVQAPNLTTLTSINFSGNQLTDVGDLGKWGEAPNLTTITNINFANNRLTDIGDLGKWVDSPNLTTISGIDFVDNQLIDVGNLGRWGESLNLEQLFNINFSRNQLTNVGDLGKWGAAPKLATLANIRFDRNQLTDIGDIGKWGEAPDLTTLSEIRFENNQLTYIGDLGAWRQASNLTTLSNINFTNNQLTDIGDIGKWGEAPSLSLISNIHFANNQLTNIGDLGEWGNISGLIVILGISFNNNQLTDIGDLSNWNNLSTLNTNSMVRLNFSDNNIEIVTADDNLLSKPFITTQRNNDFNFQNQRYTREQIYVNKHGLSVGDITDEVEVILHNPFNATAGTEGEYGAHTLTPDAGEVYISGGITLTPTAVGKSPLRTTVGDTAATYTIEQLHREHTTNKTYAVNYAATVTHPLSWIDLSIEAEDFNIRMGEIATKLVTDADVRTEGNAVVILIDENGVTQNVVAEVDAAEYAAIQSATTVQTLPLTFSYEYNGITVSKTINATLLTGDNPVLTASPTVVSIPVGTNVNTIDFVDGMNWSDTEDTGGAIQPVTTAMLPTSATSQIAAINTTTKGNVFPVTYQVTDSDTNVSNAVTRYYVIGEVIGVGDDYVLFGKDFARKLNDAQTDSNAQIITNADVSAVKLSDGTLGTVQVITKNNYAVEIGAHTITFDVLEDSTTTANVTAFVYDEVNPIDAEAMNAKDFAIKLEDVSAENFLSQSGVEAWDISGLNLEPQVAPEKIVGTINIISSLPTTIGTYPVIFESPTGKTTITVNVTVYDDIVGTLALNAEEVIMTVTAFNDLTSDNDLTVAIYGNPVQYDLLANTPSSIQPTFTAVVSGTTIGTAVAGTYSVTYTAGSLNATKALILYDDIVGTNALNANNVIMSVAEFNSLANVDILAGSGYANARQFDLPANTPSSIQPTFTVVVSGTTIGTAISGIYPLDITGNGLTANKTLTLYDGTNGSYGINAQEFTMKVEEFNSLLGIEEIAGAIYGNPVQYDLPSHAVSNLQPTFTVTASATIGSAVAGIYTATYSANGISVTKNFTLTDYDDEDATHGLKAYNVRMSVMEFNNLATVDILAGSGYADSVMYDKPANTVSSPQPIFTVATDAVIGSAVAGIYNLDITVNTLTANKTLELYDDATKVTGVEGLYANNFRIGLSKISVSNFYTYSNVVAYDETSQPHVRLSQSAITLMTVLPTTVGVHLVTFELISGTSITVNVDVYEVSPPPIDKIYPEDLPIITGTGILGNTITVTFPDGSTDTTIVDGSGNWQIVAPIELDPGDVVKAIQTDSEGEASQPTTRRVSPAPPNINPIYPGENPDVTGTGTPGNTITVTFPDGSIDTTIVAPDGTWSVISPINLEPEDIVKADETDLDGNTSKEKIAKVIPYPPTIDPIKPGPNPDVCGQGTPGNIITVTFPDGSVVKVVVAPDGTWCTVSPIPLAPQDIIEADETDNEDNASDKETVVVGPTKPSINPIAPSDTDICGTGLPGNEITVIFPDGSTAIVIVMPDGTWCVTVTIELVDGDEVAAIQKDPQGNTSDQEKVIVSDFDVIIEGNNFTVYVSEVQSNLSRLEQFVIARSNAKATLNNTGEQIAIYADVSNLEATVGTYNIELTTYDVDARASSVVATSTNEEQLATVAQEAIKIASKNLEVTVVADEVSTSSLPITGESIPQLMIAGLMTIFMSLFFLISNTYRRYSKK